MKRAVTLVVFFVALTGTAIADTLSVTQSGTSSASFGFLGCNQCDSATLSQFGETFILTAGVPFTPSLLPITFNLTENTAAAVNPAGYIGQTPFTVTLNGVAHTFDLSVTDAIAVSGTRTVSFSGDSFVYSFADGSTIALALAPFSATAPFDTTFGSNGPDLSTNISETLTYTPAATTAVPEPSSLLLVAGGLAATCRRFSRNRHDA